LRSSGAQDGPGSASIRQSASVRRHPPCPASLDDGSQGGDLEERGSAGQAEGLAVPTADIAPVAYSLRWSIPTIRPSETAGKVDLQGFKASMGSPTTSNT
jgi:hypothetical protein